MAKYRMRQGYLWDQLPEVTPPGLQEVQDFLDMLSEFDDPLVSELERQRGNGRNDYPVVAMWNLFAVSHFLRRCRRSALLEELGRNAALAGVLGFRRRPDGTYMLPPKWVCSRFEAKLKGEDIQRMEQQILQGTVKQLKDEIPE